MHMTPTPTVLPAFIPVNADALGYGGGYFCTEVIVDVVNIDLDLHGKEVIQLVDLTFNKRTGKHGAWIFISPDVADAIANALHAVADHIRNGDSSPILRKGRGA